MDGHLRAGDGLWAVGDITGKGQFTLVAVYQGRVAAADILGQEHPTADYRAVPRVTFIDPEVASVGLTAQKAREEGINVRVGLTETKTSARGWIHGRGAEHGVIKLVADADRKILIGGSVMAPAAGEVVGVPDARAQRAGTDPESARPHLSLPDIRTRDRGCSPAA